MKPTARSISLLGFALVWGYLLTVSLLGATVAGVRMRLAYVGCLFVAGCVVACAIATWAGRRGRIDESRLKELGLMGIVIFSTLVAVDFAYGAWASERDASRSADIDRTRRLDPRVWHGELMPDVYDLAGGTIRLYKPNQIRAAEIVGDYYQPSMLASPTLADSVLEPRQVTYAIDALGLRETTPPDSATALVLGDSFAFGYGTDQGDIWPEVLEDLVGEAVYNLGVSSTGPQSHLSLLEHFLAPENRFPRARRLLWLVYEGNDLENSYAVPRPVSASDASWLARMADRLTSLPGRMRNQSIIGRIRSGRLRLGGRGADGAGSSRTTVDGVTIPLPLYHSPIHGYRLFNRDYVNRATRPRSYVMRHPNRPALDRVFGEMKTLAERHHLEVTVLLAPTAARVHGAQFEGFPELSEEPWFLLYVDDLARRNGFESVNLLPALRWYAETDLLYQRDDHHWNEIGNRIVAGIVARAVWGATAP